MIRCEWCDKEVDTGVPSFFGPMHPQCRKEYDEAEKHAFNHWKALNASWDEPPDWVRGVVPNLDKRRMPLTATYGPLSFSWFSRSRTTGRIQSACNSATSLPRMLG